MDDSGTRAVIILAAGLGKRMKSDKPKVLHELMGRPMVLYVTETASRFVGGNIVVVVGHRAEAVREVVSEEYKAIFAFQPEQLGTGHAVMCAMDELPDSVREVVVLCGDVPLLKAETVQRLLDVHGRGNLDLSLLAVRVENPTGYGRVLLDEDQQLIGIVEEADATPEQKRIDLVNSGIFCFNRAFLEQMLPRLKTENAQGEYYLTDLVGFGYRERRKLGVAIGEDPEEVIGINSLEELMKVEAILRRR